MSPLPTETLTMPGDGRVLTKLDRIAEIRADVQKNIDPLLTSDFTPAQTAIVDAFMNVFIDRLVDIEIEVQQLRTIVVCTDR